MKNLIFLFLLLLALLLIIYLFRKSVEPFEHFEEKKNTKQERPIQIIEDTPLDFIKTNKYKLIANNGSVYIWEPEIIDNYFPLGHLVTKENKPPKKLSLLLASNKKPEDFIPVGMFNDSHLMWKPLPHGLGYVVSKSKPSVNKIRIIDPKYLKKSHITNMFYESPAVGDSKGYSLWNINNSNYFYPKTKDSIDLEENLYSVPENITLPKRRIRIDYTNKYDKIWENKVGSKKICIWRPNVKNNYVSLGDIVSNTDPNGKLNTPIVHKDDTQPIIDWDPHTVKHKTKDTEINFWKPISRPGYGTLGSVVSIGNKEPSSDYVFSIPLSNLQEEGKNLIHVWNNMPETKNICSIWSNNNFIHSQSHWNNPDKLIFKLNLNTILEEKDIGDTKKELILGFIPKNNNYEENNIVKTLSSKLDINKNRIIIKKIQNNSIYLTIEQRSKGSVEKTSENVIIELSRMIEQNIPVKSTDHSNILLIINKIEVLGGDSDTIYIK